MIVQRAPDEVQAWAVAFFERGQFRGERWVPGRFKHVLAFGYSEPCRTWVVVNCTFGRLQLFVMPDGAWGMAALAELVEPAAAVLRLDRPAPSDGVFARPLTCVSVVAHLVGVRGAVLPDGLWRSCLRAGATIIRDGKQQQPSPLRPTAAA